MTRLDTIAGAEYEFLNLYLVLIDFIALAVLAKYIWDLGGRNWRDPELGLGAGLTLYVLGHMTIRGWTWLLRFWPAQGWGEFPLGWVPGVIPTGLLVTTLGLVLIIRSLYSTVTARVWAILALVAALVAAYVTYAI